MLIAREKHTHHSFYFIKMLKNIADDIVSIIRTQDLLIIIARKLALRSIQIQRTLIIIKRFLSNTSLNALYSKYKQFSLRYIHNSLNLKNRIATFIRKKKLLAYLKKSDVTDMYLTYTEFMFS